MAACSSCSGSGSIMSQRMVYASQGSYQTLIYDPCTRCGGSGHIKDRHSSQNIEPMGFIDSLSAIITLAISIFICWNISETAIYSELTMNGKFTLMVVSFIFGFLGTSVILTLPFVQKLMMWFIGLVAIFIGFMILAGLS
jgi:hypothetical protein